jgi:tape measure domain-containing protein
MASVDDRIVRMEFDNAAFERKVGTTLTSLNQLDKALKFENAGQGLTGLQGVFDKFNIGNIGTHIESASAKFLAFGALAIGVLSNIASKAVDAGMQMAKSLVLEAPMAGFREYELKMGSIQTIMAGSGESLDTVNKKLQELNEYSDKTIYSFKDMTSNIGKFTNAGISLDQSVASIQGIANVAAISGANAEEASRAMYNFAQALSRGNVQLIDWKSIEMANMATKEFKQQLIDSAVAAGTLTKRGEEYITTAGKAVTSTKGFNDSLTDGWLTTEALNATLGRYSDTTTDIGKRATAAAQDIKTFTQMMSTLKETAGSGWSQSFEIMFGNFEEGKTLWTSLGTAIGDFVNKNADARNKLLQDWKDMGGRGLLIQSMKSAIGNLADILTPIKEAFQDIFPPMTAERLMEMTRAFAQFAQSLKPSEQTVENIGRIFKGLFGILEIGWEVIKQTARFFGQLIDAIAGASSGSFLAFLARIGDFFTGLNKMLVEGEGIKNFFDILAGVISVPIALIGDLKDGIFGFFGAVSESSAMDKTGETFGRLSDRLEHLKDVFKKILGLWDPLLEFASKVKGVFDEVFDVVMDVVDDLASKLSAALKSGEFSAVLDALNVGLFGGLLLVMNKFINKGIKINATLEGLFGGGLFQKIENSFDALTKTLGAMQAKLKAEALMKIATAIGILTASVLVLSLIDSEALTKALLAMSVGFGQLMGAFAILMKMSVDPKSAAMFSIVSAGMIILASAVLILAGAMAIMATMDPEQMGTGLIGLTAMLTVLTAAVKPMSKVAPQMVLAGTGLLAISGALVILAGAVKLFSLMDWQETAEGFIALGAGLVIIAGAMKLMPMQAVLTGPALLAIAVAMNILAGALKLFATMSWGDIGKGLVTLAGALVAIGFAMNLMPTNMLLTAPALVAVAFALNIIAGALKIMATMSWGDIARGLTAMAGSLLVLAVATTAMSGSIPGAIAIGIVAGSLLVLAMVLKAFAKIKTDELIYGLIAIAAALGTLGLVAYALQPAVGALLGLGAALVLIGGGFALFGLGIDLVTQGLERFVELGPAAGAALTDFLQALGAALPALMTGLGKGLLEMAKAFLEGIDPLLDLIISMLGKLIDGIETLIPKVLVVVGKLIEGIIHLLGFEYVPAIIDAGLNIIMSFLEGIRDNIGEVATVVGEIITNFIDALAVQVPSIIRSISKLFTEIWLGVAEALGRVAGTLLLGVGIAFMDGLLQGVSEGFKKVSDWFGKIGDLIKYHMPNPITLLYDIGQKIVQGLLNGLKAVWHTVTSWVSNAIQGIKDTIASALDIFSPSKYMIWIGEMMIAGLVKPFQQDSSMEATASKFIGDTAKVFDDSLASITNNLGDISEFQPRITPVLDLTEVKAGAQKISDYISSTENIPLTASYDQARTIVATPSNVIAPPEEDPTRAESTYGVKFEQNIYAPAQLSTSDIYKQTRNQITMAKEELKIP